jgi:hypothetical protein
MLGEDWIDMDDAYPELQDLYRNGDDEEKERYKKLVDAYVLNRAAIMFTYPTEEMKFTINAHTLVDEAFACPTRRREDGKIMLNYISEARNINDALDASTEEYITARFICRIMFNVCTIEAIAEEAAIAVSRSQDEAEDLYLRMKKFHKLGIKYFCFVLCRRDSRVEQVFMEILCRRMS